jgi:hypothetical protein
MRIASPRGPRPVPHGVLSACLLAFPSLAFLLLAWGSPSRAAAEASSAGGPALVTVFEGAPVHFLPDSAAKYERPGLTAADGGRLVRTRVTLPEIAGPHRITALLTVRPVPKTDREVFDRWDRAGNVRLVEGGMPPLEVVRFMTAYGGRTDHEVDVTHLAPLLRGERTFEAFVDTWSSPGWTLDVALRYTPVRDHDNATWASPLFYADSFNREEMPAGAEVDVEIPAGLRRVVMKYLSTGHCTDGTDADEFISKANVISVDGTVVARYHPWRDDCRKYRDRNPYTARWTDGSWSSDYARSGWCPGTEVLPLEFDLTDHLTPGRHRIGFCIEDIRPKDENGHFGYWRVSAHLVGWDRPPDLWRNEE